MCILSRPLLHRLDEGFKTMETGKRNAGKLFVDYLGQRPEKVKIEPAGKGEFKVDGGSVSVWVEAPLRLP